MDAVLGNDEYTLFLDADDCALLQLGAVSIVNNERTITLCLQNCEGIAIEETENSTRIMLSPTTYTVLLQIHFAVANVRGKKIWLRMEESKLEERSAVYV
jgi:hypothetical protein